MNSQSPKPPNMRKNRLMSHLNNLNNPNNETPTSTKYLEFSINESDQNKLFQSVRFSSPSETPVRNRGRRNFGSSGKKSFSMLLNNPNYGVKCLVAFLSLENVLMKKKLKKLKQDIAIKNVLLKAKTTVTNIEYTEQSKKLKFYQARCLELELENSKLKNWNAQINSNSSRRSKSPSFSRKGKRAKKKKTLRCDQCQGKILVEEDRQGLKKSRILRNSRKSIENKENDQNRANKRKRSRSRSASRRKSVPFGRSKSNTKSMSKMKNRSSSVNTRIMPISKSVYKHVLKLRNAKVIAMSQMMDIHRSHLIEKLRQNLLFQPSIKNDADRKEISQNIKTIAFFRWKMMHGSSSGVKMNHDQLRKEIDRLKSLGKMMLNGEGKSSIQIFY